MKLVAQLGKLFGTCSANFRNSRSGGREDGPQQFLFVAGKIKRVKLPYQTFDYVPAEH